MGFSRSGGLIGLLDHGLCSRAGSGGKRVGLARLDLGARANGREIELGLRSSAQPPRDGRSSDDSCDYNEMRDCLHSAQQFRLRQTR